VTRENWRATLVLTVLPEQQRFISDYVPIAAIALAKAYIRPAGLLWIPYAFYNNDEMVGFTDLAYEPGSLEDYWLFHFFIDYRYQGQGYGKEALHILIQFIRNHHPQCQAIQLTVNPENERAKRLYTSAGFQPTGTELSDEPVYKLTFTIANRSGHGN
jgi:diamine N-acetyltransferase